MISESVCETYDECELELVSQPKIEITQLEKGKEFIFTAEVAVKPEVKLGEYKGLKVDKVSTRVTQKEVDEEIEKEREKEQRVFNRNYPALNMLLDHVNRGERLWERQKTDDDFLCIRVGTGQLSLQAKIDYPERHFDITEDPLEMQMYNLVEKPIVLADMPILASLAAERINGVVGNRKQVMQFVQNILLQLTTTHSYDDVKLVFLADTDDMETLEFVKYLPHIWNDQRTFRFLACDVTEAYSISEYLKQELEVDLDSPRELKEILKQHPLLCDICTE